MASNNVDLVEEHADERDNLGSKVTASYLWDKAENKYKVMLRKIVQTNNKAYPTSPLYSIETFDVLCIKPELLKGAHSMGFNAMSKIQKLALPILIADPAQNMIAQSESGTGKTVAFVMAMLHRVDPMKLYPQVICLSPTYELAIQTGEVAARMARFCPEIQIMYAVRGERVNPRSEITAHILIGTPRKVLEWGLKYCVFDLSRISVFVLDEADVMLATQEDCVTIHRSLPRTCQTMFFSATYEPEVRNFADMIAGDALQIRLLREEECLDNIKQYYINCQTSEEKYTAVKNIYDAITIGQAIIFCRTKSTARWLAKNMTINGRPVAMLSGDLPMDKRLQVLDKFRHGLYKFIVTTNVLSRGIDVQRVTLVVNFDLPMNEKKEADFETYLNRIGRTGRFGKSGIAINLIDSPKAWQLCKDIQIHFGKKIRNLDAEDAAEM
ncbi:DEAD-box helicase Dbp80-like [Temnothorax americanus]|uniref:DEAD-box helicase Dbp80-like n=1 Tax=Temnothorax americanus TaxID=1964332 RepID=UPI004068C401